MDRHITQAIREGDLPSPAYIISEPKLRENVEIFEQIQRETGCKVILALKAFSTFGCFPIIAPYLAGTTASSAHEAQLGKEEFGKEVHVYAPAYSKTDFNTICSYANHITFNSVSQWQQFKDQAARHRISCGLRINPEHSEVTLPIYDPCAPCSRLGVTKTELDGAALDGLSGIHFHTLCGKHVESLERTLSVVEEKFSTQLQQVDWANFGGGHGITYTGYDVDRLCEVISRFQNKYGVQVILEPGEGIVYNTGFLAASVLDIVKNEMDIAILDTSATAHMPDVLEMPYRPEIIDAGQAGEKEHTYRLGGNTCLSGDVIGDYSFDTPLEIGDVVVFTDMSHYTMVKNTTFNGLTLPAIAILRDDESLEVVKTFGYSDFKGRLG